MSCSSRRIASNYLLNRGELIANPLVEVSSDGVILSVSSYDPSQIDCLEHTEHYSGVMVAGFINAHCHLELSYLCGAIPPGGGFAAFANGVAQQRGAFSADQRRASIAAADLEMQREGIVGVCDIMNGDSSFNVKSTSAINYLNQAELFGLRATDLSAIEPLLSYPSTYATPHSLYSLNDDLLRRVAQMGGADSPPLSIHFMESEAEGELFNRKGSLYDWYVRAGFECDFLHYDSPAHRLISIVPPERSVMLIHNCFVTQRDIELIMNHFTAPVYWVLCPRSNSYISGVTPPVDLLWHNGLTICVGTDSLASNWSLSMVEELRLLGEMSGASLAECAGWATANGAAAIGLHDRGSIEVGMRPSINILSNLNYNTLTLTEESVVHPIH